MELPGGVVGIGPGQLVDERAVQVGRAHAEVGLQLVERAVDVRCAGRRDRPTSTPGSGCPSTGCGRSTSRWRRQPLAELPVLDVLRRPGDLLVELDHPVTEGRDLHEPGVDGLLDQRVAAAPAVRVRVVVGLAAQQHALDVRRTVLQVVDDVRVRVEHLHALVRRHGRVELADVVDGHHDLDAGRVGDDLVLLTERRRDVHHAGAVVGGDVARGEHLVGVLPADEEVERRRVAQADELGALEGAEHLRLLPQLTGVGSDAGGGEHVALAIALHQGVLDVRVDGHREVGRQGPRRGGPDQGERPVDRVPGRGQPQPDGDRGILPVLVDVVHLRLGGRERGAVVPAVPEDAEALVDQALVVEALERPDDALHVGEVEGLVVVVEVDPARLAGDVGLPLVGVAQHRLLAGGVERRDAHLVDLVLVLDAQLALGLGLGRHAVGVPAEAALDVLAAHRLVTRDDVLDVTGEQVAVVRQAVGEGRAVVEDELVAPFSPAGRASTEARNVSSAAQKSRISRSSAGNDGCAGTWG